MPTLGTYYYTLNWEMYEWIHDIKINKSNQLDSLLSLLYTSFTKRVLNPCSEPMRVMASSNFRFYALMLLCLHMLKPGVFAYLILLTWSVHLLPPSKLDDDNCLLVKPT